jgi:hypothetical protein
MLIKLNDDTFINKDNVTHVELVRGNISTRLEFNMIGGAKIIQEINSDYPDHAAAEILKNF